MPRTPLPYKKLIIVSLILFANNASIWMIFSYLPFMVKYYYPHTDTTELGYLAGILGSAFSLGSLCGNFMWGLIADRYGRRPALLFGLLGTALSAGLFGISPNFWIAVFARFLWGLLNGNIGVGKTYMAEIHDDSNSAKGMAVFGVIGGLGRTFGPIIGGFLSQPANHYNYFHGTFFDSFPFALPSLIIVVLCFSVFIVAYFQLEETLTSTYSPLLNKEEDGDIDLQKPLDPLNIDNSIHHNKSNRIISDIENNNVELTSENFNFIQSFNKYLNNNTNSLSSSSSSSLNSTTKYTKISSNDCIDFSQSNGSNFSQSSELELQSLPQKDSTKKKKKKLTFNGIVELQNLESGKCEYAKLKKISNSKVSNVNIKNSNSGNNYNNEYDNDDNDNNNNNNNNNSNNLENQTVLSVNSIDPEEFKNPKVKFTNGSEMITPEVEKEYLSDWNLIFYLFRVRMIVITIFLYGLLSFVHVIAVEILPLWLVIPEDNGGFGFTSSQIGLIITLSGPINICSQLFIYPYLVNSYGTLYVFKLGMIIYGISAFILPFSSTIHFHSNFLLSEIIVTLVYSILTSAAGWSFVCIFIFVNNSCYSHQRGKVNGIGQSFASFGRLIGPVCGSSIFAWSVSNNTKWPFNYYFVWYLVAFGAILIWKISCKLPKKIVKRRREPIVPRYAQTMNNNVDEEE